MSGIILILTAFVLCIYNIIFDYTSGKNSKEALEEIENILQERTNEESEDYLDNPDKEMPKINIKGKNYIGIISISKIDIELPVLDEYTVSNLNKAPVLYKGSIYRNNAVIIAHNSLSHFKKIQQLQEKDQVIFTDLNGHKFQYEVIKKENISEKNPDLLDDGEWDLSLFTCNSSNTKYRVVLRLKLINSN